MSRYTPPPIRLQDLPRVDFVLIPHDHYDHLDEPTVRQLAHLFDARFIVPLGLKAWMADRGITNVVELEWGQSVTVDGLEIVCTLAQHGSGRTLADQGRRLWSSWAVLGSKRFYFAGDTPVHISPEEALQAWIDLRARQFIGVHWGTFGLAREPYDEPPKRIAAEVERQHLDPKAVWVLRPGKTENL